MPERKQVLKKILLTIWCTDAGPFYFEKDGGAY